MFNLLFDKVSFFQLMSNTEKVFDARKFGDWIFEQGFPVEKQ